MTDEITVGSLEDGELVLTGSPEHRAQCKHNLFDGFGNVCLECGHKLGPNVLEQLAGLRERIGVLESLLGVEGA